MKLAIMQPYFMPYIGYFQAISAVDKYILYSNLNFIKEAWMNRNRLLLKDGRIYQFTVPLLHKSSNQMIGEVKIDNTKPWAKNLLLTIASNYNKSPYFSETYPLLEELLNRRYDFLYELNAACVTGIADFLGLRTVIEYDNSRFLDMEEDLSTIDTHGYERFPYMEKTSPIKKTARVIEMCRREGAQTFINAIGGQALYDKVEFSKYGIDLKFVKTGEIAYPQHHDFQEPNLSIIDVLMFNGKEGTRELLEKYTLV